MKLELQSASNFLVHLVKLGRRNLNDNQLEKFRLALIEVLRRRYRDHWFPEKPFKGSGYRCIRINGKMDPVISQAGEACGLSQQLIHSTFPSELTMWIDPLEVSYRIGENGSVCVLYEYKEGVNDPWKPNLNLLKGSSKNNSSNKNNACVKQQQEQQQKKKEKNHSGGSIGSSSSSGASSDGSVTPPPSSSPSPPTVPCKDSLRKMDYLLDPRKSVSIEQLAAYVAS